MNKKADNQVGLIWVILALLTLSGMLYSTMKELEELKISHAELMAQRIELRKENASLYIQLSNSQDKLTHAQRTLEEIFSREQWFIEAGVATAYSPYDNVSGIEAQGDPSVTSTGMTSGPGVIAVDPKKIPYGSQIKVMYPNGIVTRGIAGDTGGALRRNPVNQVDIFKRTYAETVKHGRQKVIILWQP